MPMETVYKALLKAGALDEEQKKKKENKDKEGQYCQYHKRPVGHSIQDYQDFLGLVQELMDEGRIEFCKIDKRASCECLTRGNLKTSNHLLPGRRPASPCEGTYPSHP